MSAHSGTGHSGTGTITATMWFSCDHCSMPLRFTSANEWAAHQRSVHPTELSLVRPRPKVRSTTRRARRRSRQHERPARPRRSGPAGHTPERAGWRVAEGKPWEPYNSDGSLNLGSYGVGAAEGMVLLAHDLLLGHLGPQGEVATQGQLAALARRLLEAADRTQAAVRADGRFDRMDTSHVRSRAAIRAAVEVHPVPWGRPEAYDGWVASMAEYATVLLRTTIALVR